MKTMKPSSIAMACASLLLGGHMTLASATPVAEGSTINLSGTTVAADPFLAGTVLEDNLVSFSLPESQLPGAAIISGTFQERVVRETTTGTLDFYWRILDVSNGTLGHLRLGNFADTSFDANYRIDGLGDVGPSSITRFSGALSNYVNFNFRDALGNGTLGPGQSSNFMFLRTNATQYAKTAYLDIANPGTYTASTLFMTFTPAVPEPETYALLLSGLALLGAVARRKTLQRD